MNKKRVVVLGGGISSLTTVYELLKSESFANQYEVEVYQMGWRLGGKGASGRNQEKNNRIEEHGLHLWFGFYDNAFSVIKEVYKDYNDLILRGEVDKNRNPISWNEAFKPRDFVVLKNLVDREWRDEVFSFPKNNKVPGCPTQEGFDKPLRNEYRRLLFRSILANFSQWKINYKMDDYSPFLTKARQRLKLKLIQFLVLIPLLAFGVLSYFNRFLEMLTPWMAKLKITPFDYFMAKFWLSLEKLFRKSKYDSMYSFWLITDFFMAIERGIYRDRLFTRKEGFNYINHLDFKCWLKSHWCSDRAANSGIVNVLYSLIFSSGSESNAFKHPGHTFEAGTALRAALRLVLTYRGSFYYHMMGGMGDIVLTPFYEVLKSMGVKFKFFHQITRLNFNSSENRIETIEFVKQAEVKGNKEYEPLINVKGLGCWPSAPLKEQLDLDSRNSETEIDFENPYIFQTENRHVLTYHKDYHFIVNGISLKAQNGLIPNLEESNENWKLMLDKMTTTKTQSTQFWFKRDLAGLRFDYWNQAPILLGSYTYPLDTWADLSDLIPLEDWDNSGSEHPKHLAYLCGPNDQEYSVNDHIRNGIKFTNEEQAGDFLKKFGQELWPEAYDENGSFIVGNLSYGIEGQYYRINSYPSDEYVLSEVGTSKYRIKPDGLGIKNFIITGDWTDNGFNAGCIEATVISGKLAAKALLSMCGEESLDVRICHVGDDI